MEYMLKLRSIENNGSYNLYILENGRQSNKFSVGVGVTMEECFNDFLYKNKNNFNKGSYP